MRRSFGICILSLVMIFLNHAVVGAAYAEEKIVPYKTDTYSTEGLLLKLVLILVIIALIAYGISYLIQRYYFGGLIKKAGSGDITLVELKRLSPQLTVYRIKIDTTEVLLAQSNNGLQVLCKNEIEKKDDHVKPEKTA